MADDIQGGLNAVTQPEEPIAPVAQEASEEALYKGDATERLRKQRLAYDQHLQRMIESFKGRTTNLGYDPKMLALSKGFLTPGKTGNFFESLGTAVGGYGEAAQEEQKLKLEDELTREKLLGLQLGQTEKDYALEKEAKANEIRRKIYEQRVNKNKPSVGLDGKPNISDILSSSSQASDGLLTLDFIYAQPSYMQKELLDMYKVQQEDLKAQTEKSKPTEFNVPFKGLVKGTVAQYEKIETLRTHPWYQSLPIEEKKKAMQEAYAQLGIGEEQPIEEPVSGTTKVGDGKKIPTLETTSQKEQRKLLEGKAGEKIIEADQEERKYVKGLRDNSNGIIQSADILYNLASNPKTKEAFGVLQKQGIVNALLGLAEEGIGGEALSIRIKGIEDATRKLKYTDSEGKPINPNDLINAVRVANQQIGKLSLSFAQIYLKGQGAVSDFERKLVEDTIPNTKDPATSMMLKAELLKARAMFDRDMGRAAMNYINKDPLHRTIEQYKATDEYRGFVDKLDSSSRGIMQTYFPDANVAPQSKPSSAPTGNYADIVKQEKERRSLR
jgi:hypothetical protein